MSVLAQSTCRRCPVRAICGGDHEAGRIGDFILALSAIRLVLQHHGEQNCALLIAPAVEELARLEFPRAMRIVIPAFPRHKRAFTEWRRVRRRLASVTCGSLVCLRHQRWDYHELMLSWIRSERKFVLDDTQAAAWTVGRRFTSVRVRGSHRLCRAGRDIARRGHGT